MTTEDCLHEMEALTILLGVNGLTGHTIFPKNQILFNHSNHG